MGPFKKKELIGLDIGTSSLKLAQLKKSAKGYELVKAGLKPLPPGAISEDEISDKKTVIESIKQFMHETEGQHKECGHFGSRSVSNHQKN